MIEDELRQFASRLFRTYAVERVDARQGEDHAGTPVINVVIVHRLIDRPIEFRTLFPLDRQLRDAAWQAGERRFVHVKHQYDEEQQFAAVK